MDYINDFTRIVKAFWAFANPNQECRLGLYDSNNPNSTDYVFTVKTNPSRRLFFFHKTFHNTGPGVVIEILSSRLRLHSE